MNNFTRIRGQLLEVKNIGFPTILPDQTQILANL